MKLRDMLIWYDYKGKTGEIPICVCDHEELKKFVEEWEKEHPKG